MTEGNGPTVSLRLTKKEGVPVYRTSDDGQGLPIVERRVSELGFYSLGLNDLAGHVNLSPPRTSVMVRYLQLEDDETFFKEIAIGRLKVKRYSQHAIKAIRDLIACENIDEIWQKHRPRPKLTKKDRR